MKRNNGKLLNKALAIAVTASLVLSLTPAAAIAEFSGEGQRDIPSSTDSSAADNEIHLESSDAATSGSGDAAQGDAPSSSENAQPSASSSSAQTEGSQEASSSASPGNTSASSEGSGAASEEQLLSDLTKLDLVEVDPVSREDLTNMLSSAPAYAPRSLLSEKDAAAAAFPSELDGSTIEKVSVEWITSDTKKDGDDSQLSLVPNNDDEFSVRMRLNMALSGEHDYEAGDIQVTVPKSIFETRDGKATGTLSLSVPEAPDSRALFNYTDMGDCYLLTNTRKLSAATMAMFEFTLKDLVPHTIVDGVATAPFEGTVQVTTHLGNTISMSSNQIDCTIDTAEKVWSASKRATMLSEEWPSSWPAELKPTNDKDYIYVDWYTNAWISGNQAFDMKVEENASTNQSPGAVLLGYRDSSSGKLYGVGNSNRTEHPLQLQKGTYVSPGTAFGGHAYVAYPKANFQVNNEYKLDNTVKYTLTSADDRTVTEASATGETTYSPVAFQAPKGSYGIEKRGDGSSTKFVDGDVEGIYGYALNQLRKGEAVDLSYNISSHSFTAPNTKDPAGNENNPDSYNKKTVNLKLVDDETYFNFADKCLSAADFQFKSVQVNKPSMLVYKKFSQSGSGYTGESSSLSSIQAGTYAYVNDNDPASIPVLYVYGKNETGDWVRYASLDWTSGSLNAVAENGASVSSSTVNFPEGIVDYKIELSTNRDGIFLSAQPTMTLKATDAVKAQIEELYAKSNQPTTKTSNKVTLTASGEDGTEYGQASSVGRDRLDGTLPSLAVRQTNQASYKSDSGESCVNIHYQTTVYEQSNLTDTTSYNQAISTGAIQAEHEGTFYDLLPMGVEPITDSVKVRDSDTITGVQTIENYKNSGRTLLVVKAKLSPSLSYRFNDTGDLSGYCDVITMSFDAKYAWTSLTDYGKKINNVISFESGNDQLGTIKGYSGEPDDPTVGNYSGSKDATSGVEELMTDLDPNRDTNSFTYANCETDLAVDTSAVTGFKGHVSVNGDGYYDNGMNNDYPRNVYENGRYTYRLRMQNTEATSSRGIVMYDNLENYVPAAGTGDNQDTQWRGTLSRVDVSQLRQKGIEPVVYYSTKSGLNLDDTNNPDMNLRDSSTWTTVCPDKKSEITAIAIDASKDTQGNDFVLGKGESIVSYIHMVAPKVRDLAKPGEENQWYDSKLENGQAEAGLTGGAHAYNNVTMLATTVSVMGSESSNQLIHDDYTKVGLLPFGLETTKTWSDNDNQDGKRPDSVKVHLYANGKDTGKSAVLSAENKWFYNWTAASNDIWPVDSEGTPINYTFVEDKVPGYTLSASKSVDNGVFKFVLTNRHTPEKVSIPVSKTWDDNENAANTRPDSITLKLYRGDDLLRTQQVKSDASGNWSYSFDGLDKYKNGAEINYSVQEDYVPGYVAAYGDNGEITNKYDPYGNLTISKTIEGATPAAAGKEFTFKLSLAKENNEVDTGDYAYTTSDGRSGTIAAGGTLTLKGGQTATIKNLPSEDSYAISEVETDGYTIADASNTSGTIHAGQTANASITNTYESTGSVQLKANKVLTGRTLANKQFSFQVLDEDGNVLRTASCKADGSVAFGLIKYNTSDDGKTYTYYIQEKVPADAVNAEGVTWENATVEQKAAGGFSKKGYTYDSSKHKVTVAVADNGDGTMKATPTYEDGDVPQIENAYNATGSVTLNLWKTLAARDLKDGEFTFGLFDEQGNAVRDKNGKAITAKNAADGTVTFPSISYDQTNAGHTYTYVAKEIIPNEGAEGYDKTVVYDKTEWKYRVSVHDNGDGTLSFDQTTIAPDGEEGKLPVIANTLKPGGLTISKGIKNGNPEKPGQEFKFLVKLTNPTGESLDGNYDFERKQGISQTAELESEVEPEVESSGVSVNADGEPMDTNESSGVNADSEPMDANLSDDAAPLAATKSGECGSCVFEFGDDGVFTIRPKNGVDGTLEEDWLPWLNDRDYKWDRYEVKKVKIEGTVHTGKFARQFFNGFINLESIDGLAGLDTSAATDMALMFCNCKNLTSLDLSGFHTSHVTDMQNMFDGCSALTSLNLKGFDTSQVKTMYAMFKNCSALTSLDLSDFKTPNVTDMHSMFNGCSSLKSLDVSKFDTSCVGTMDTMFYGCGSLESLDLSSFSTPSLQYMGSAFRDCVSLKSLDVRNFDTSNVHVGNLLSDCESLSKIVLGEKPFLKGAYGSVADLPDPPSSPASQFTGKWACEDHPSIAALDAKTLSNSHPSADAPAGTWVWQKKPMYTVTFDANLGSGNMAQQSYEPNTEYQLPANSFYCFAKKFVGWNTAADGKGTSYVDGATVKNLANVGENVTLYAQWEDDLSGTLTNGQMEVTMHGNESLTIPNLPAGTQYQVYEQTPSGWVLVKQSGESGVIEPLNNAQATFVNEYQPGKIQATIVGTKTVNGDASKVNAGDYSFELLNAAGKVVQTVKNGAGGSIAFAPITYEAAGTWTYTVKEVVPQDRGNIQYDEHEESVTVTVSDDLSSSVQYDSDGVVFKNFDTTPTTGSLSITKEIEGGVVDASKEFTFDVTTIKDGVRTTEQVKVGAGKTLDVGEFPEGTTYSIAETDIPAGYTLKDSPSDASGTIVAGKTQNATFTNAYSAKGSVALKATKKLTGGTLESGKFSFELRDKAGKVVQTVANDADGSVTFEPISYDAAGTYDYTIAEVVPGQGSVGYDGSITYDSHSENVTVDVTDQHDGTLSAVATYDKDGAVFENSVKPGSIQLTKSVTGGTEAVAGKKFPFKLILKDAKGEPLSGTFACSNTNGATGTIKNGDTIEVAADQTVKIEGIPAGATYEFVEQVPAGFVQQSANAVQGVVGAKETARASVVNAYATSGSWTPDATKVLNGSELANGQFTFKLLDSEGNVLQTASNDSEGKIVFQPIQYTAEDHGKTFEYSIVEVNDNQDNYVYDRHTAKVNVAVKDNGDGTMTVTPTYGTGDDGNIFTNLWKLVMPETGQVSYPLLAGFGVLVVLVSSVGLVFRRNRRKGSSRNK